MTTHPSTRRQKSVHALATVALLGLSPVGVLLLGVVGGCKASDPKISEAFVGHREAVLARTLRTAAKMQDRATTTADEAFSAADQAVQARQANFDSYEDARRGLLATEGRVRDALQHADRVKFAGDELFDRWASDLRQYSSDTLREQASARRDVARERLEEVLEQLELARESIEPIRRRLVDAALWLKHHRHQESPPDPSRSAEDQALLESQLADMRERRDAAVRSAIALADELSPEDVNEDAQPGQ